MKRYEVLFEIRMLGAESVWDTDSISLKASDLFGAITEASGVVTRIQKGYGESFQVRSWVKERKSIA